MELAINAPGHGNNVLDRINALGKNNLKEQIELLGELASNNTSKIGMIPSSSNYVSNKLRVKCIHIIKNSDRLNGLKGSTKIKKTITI